MFLGIIGSGTKWYKMLLELNICFFGGFAPAQRRKSRHKLIGALSLKTEVKTKHPLVVKALRGVREGR